MGGGKVAGYLGDDLFSKLGDGAEAHISLIDSAIEELVEPVVQFGNIIEAESIGLVFDLDVVERKIDGIFGFFFVDFKMEFLLSG